MKVQFSYGKTIAPDEMKPNSIYLDGACQGPAFNNETRSYSFDHHAGCSRFATLSSCEQVLLALDLGFNPTGMTVHINALDGDTSMSLWLLRNPDMAANPCVSETVRKIGRIDSHGPIGSVLKLHKCLERNPREPQTEEMVWEDQAKIDAWYGAGDDALPDPFEYPPCPMKGLDRHGRVVEAHGDFGTIYQAGAVIALAFVPGPDGTMGYTIGKKSDFARGDIKAFLDECNTFEPGWGGGSTIGGAPRLEGGLRSSMSEEAVWDIFRRWA